MHLLLDSSGQDLVCALADSQGIVIEERYPTGSPESRDIGTTAGRLLGEMLISELDSVIVGTGPGSFIGTRVAISYANGLAATGGVRLAGVNSLAAIAAVHGTGNSGVIRDARRGEVYLLVGLGGATETKVVPLEDLPRELVSRGVGHCTIEEPDLGDARQARTLQEIMMACTTAGVVVDIAKGVPAEGLRRMVNRVDWVDYVEPVYLRGFL